MTRVLKQLIFFRKNEFEIDICYIPFAFRAGNDGSPFPPPTREKIEGTNVFKSSNMRQIEPIAAYVPYMTCPGNHESA